MRWARSGRSTIMSRWGPQIASCKWQVAQPRMTAAGWQATDRLGLLIPAGTPPGRYTVELLVRPKGSERPLEASAADGKPLETPVPLFGLDVVPADQPVAPERLPIATRKPVDLGDGLRFLGYSADDQPVVPGDLRKVSLFWQAIAQPANDYTAFVQVLGEDGAPVALWEAPPGASLPDLAVDGRHVDADAGRFPHSGLGARWPLSSHRGAVPRR